jgi:hypothetical protein
MRKSMSLLVLNLAMGAAACELSTGEEDSDRTGTVRTQGDAGRATTLAPDSSRPGEDAGTSRDAAASADTTPPGDAGTGALPPAASETSQTPAQCALPLPTASVACAAPDVLEPNNTKEAATAIEPGTGCSLVPGKLSSHDDDDWYQFITTRSDPVRVEVAYETMPTNGVDLGFRVYAPIDGTVVADDDGRRADVTWTIADTFQSKKNFAYQVELVDFGSLTGCQGYNLRVDPQFCTDAYEDNDSQSALAKGLGYGTPLSATVFFYDEDWYDTSALATNGASCVITTDLKVGSISRLTVETYGTGSASTQSSRDANGNTPSVTIVIDPAKGTSALRVFTSEFECTQYTVTCSPL